MRFAFLKTKKLRSLGKVLVKSVKQFFADNLWTQAAALSYYTIFSLPPMLLIILQTTSLVLEGDIVHSSLFGIFRETFGRESANELVETVQNYGLFEGSWWSIALGVIGLLITSTTVFVTIQQTLNLIFRVKPKPERAWWLMLRSRLLSFAYLLGLGFILLVSLLLNTILDAAGRQLSAYMPEVSYVLVSFLSIVIPILVVVGLFAAIFRWLPDVELDWNEIWVGSLLTGLLFTIGKYAISFYIQQSRAPNMYEAASSIMVILLWVFYASLIFMFGAVFTRVYAVEKHDGVQPAPYAVKVIRQEVEQEEEERQHIE